MTRTLKPSPLTPRQMDVLRLVSEGKTNKEIANELGIACGTTCAHVRSIFQKLQVTNRTSAAVIYTQEMNS